MSKEICNGADSVLQNYLSNAEMETSHNRMMDQKNKCGYGLQGVCCKLCSNGPCRISPTKPRGVCGADADTIVCRNFLRSVAAGAGCYIHVMENTAKRLKEMAEDIKESGELVKNKKSLAKLASILQINCLGLCETCGGKNNCYDTMRMCAEAILEDIRKPYDEKMQLLEKIAITKRIDLWKKTGLMPGGAKDEVFNAVVKTSTNLNSDPADMLLQCLRLGIATGNYGLVLTDLMNDIIMSPPEISFDPVGFRVIDPEYINIMITGHQQSMFRDLEEQLQKEQIQHTAKMVGARGIRIVGCTCVGQDFQARSGSCAHTFCGHAGNNYSSEAALLTGCIDMVVSEFNCTIPGIEGICEKLEIPMLCLDDVAKKANAKMSAYSHKKKEQISAEIIAAALTGYKNRNDLLHQDADKKRYHSMEKHGYDKSISGVTEDTLTAMLGGSVKPLINLIVEGKIKGIAAIVGCSNLRAKGHDVFTVEMTKKLLKKDILILSAGCTCGGLENCGLMTIDAVKYCGPGLKSVCEALRIPPVLNYGPCLAIGRIELTAGVIADELGVDFPDLPVVISAPQWLEEQALADGAYALALGFPLHLGLAPFVMGSDTAVSVLTQELKSITGGYLLIDDDIDSTCDKIDRIIGEKRINLGLK